MMSMLEELTFAAVPRESGLTPQQRRNKLIAHLRGNWRWLKLRSTAAFMSSRSAAGSLPRTGRSTWSSRQAARSGRRTASCCSPLIAATEAGELDER